MKTQTLRTLNDRDRLRLKQARDMDYIYAERGDVNRLRDDTPSFEEDMAKTIAVRMGAKPDADIRLSQNVYGKPLLEWWD
ncbi:hypothetical protein ACIPSD_04450 [Pectobacterium sp. CHL-2024]|uniref:Uncharacterized protein n=1 Tax=Pectobacterium polonicum TaxID=2485124 RepID=A0ABV1P9H7_9GAMM